MRRDGMQPHRRFFRARSGVKINAKKETSAEKMNGTMAWKEVAAHKKKIRARMENESDETRWILSLRTHAPSSGARPGARASTAEFNWWHN